MLGGIIRSARSRLHRDSMCEDGVSAGTGVKRASGTFSSVTAGTIRGRAPSVTRSSRSSMSQRTGSENAAPEKQQAPTIVPTAVLGDATNTYLSGLGLQQKQPPAAPDSPKASIPKVTVPKERFALVDPAPPCEGDIDVDMTNAEDPQHVTEYMRDIFQVLRRVELENAPSTTYMDRQVDVNIKMRSILVDWLVDVHRKYKCQPATLFLAVQLVDRYLDIQVTARRHLQLVGATALMIAAKFEEVYPPQIKEFVYVTDKAYSKDEILQMESSILKTLDFKICQPTAMHFLERYQLVNGCTDAHRDLAQYLLELTLVDYKMLKHPPSHLAAASIFLSNKLLRRPSWPTAAVRQTNMTEAMLKPCAKQICDLLEHAPNSPLQAVRKKYSQLKHHSVAKLSFMVGPSC